MTDQDKYLCALRNFQNAMESLECIREAVELLFPDMPSADAILKLYGPEASHMAQAIVEHLYANAL